MLGQRARYERYTAEMLYVIAAGKHIDDSSMRFGELVDEIWQNPFRKPKEELKTAGDIKDYILKRIRQEKERIRAEDKNGSAEAGRED